MSVSVLHTIYSTQSVLVSEWRAFGPSNGAVDDVVQLGSFPRFRCVHAGAARQASFSSSAATTEKNYDVVENNVCPVTKFCRVLKPLQLAFETARIQVYML